MRRQFFIVGLASLTVACSNGWGSNRDEAEQLCRKTYKRMATAKGGVLPIAEADFVPKCIDTVAPAFEPCREYKHGSDSALDCMERRVGPVLQSQSDVLTSAANKAFIDATDALDGMDAKARVSWCKSATGPAKQACDIKLKHDAEDEAYRREQEGLQDGPSPSNNVDPRLAKVTGEEPAPKAHGVPNVSTGTAQVRGPLDKHVISTVVRRHLNEVKVCYEPALMKQADLVGSVLVQFTIAGTGAVVSSTVQQSTLNRPDVEQCVVAATRRWEFPHPLGGGIVIVSYPFVLDRK